jgi:AdoMet-dependent rRNA methyltransferase SPB1
MSQLIERKPEEPEEPEPETDDEEDRLEDELDAMYGDYVEAKSARDAKYRAKRARGEDDDGEWNGFSDNEKEQSDEELVADSDWSDDEEEGPKGLITSLNNEDQPTNGLSIRAARFFDQDLFKGIDGLEDLEDDEDSGIDVEGDVEMTEESATPASDNELTIRTTTKKSNAMRLNGSKTPCP